MLSSARSGPACHERALRRGRSPRSGRVEWWAHQDSNLGQAGYEPAALTAELWARRGVYQVKGQGKRTPCPLTRAALTSCPPGTRAAYATVTGGGVCAAPWLRSAGSARA